jgi:hypothetical protein
MPHQGGSHLSQEMRQCIQECLSCYATCLETVQHCLTMGGRHAEQQHIALMLTCARTCETSANAMLLGTHLHHETCRACAALCRACAEDCRRMAQGDATMERCADECERCAASCERMAGAAA